MVLPADHGLKQRLAAGATVVGTFVQTPHPVVCDFLCANFELDFVCLEAEHSAMGAETIQAMVAAADARGMPCLVRLENNDWVPVARALDAGAGGVIAPRVNSREEAQALVEAALYPPRGNRGIGPGRATRYGVNSGPDYRAAANEEVLVAAQVETRQALDNLDEILSVPGLDLAFIGPADLSSSLGLHPGSAELDSVIKGILGQAAQVGIKTGIFAAGPEAAARWVEAGAQLILLGSDLIFMAAGLGAMLHSFRSIEKAEGRAGR